MSDDDRLPHRPYGWEMVFAWCSSDVAVFGDDEEAEEDQPGAPVARPGHPVRRRWRRR